jgi:hypothetical protein
MKPHLFRLVLATAAAMAAAGVAQAQPTPVPLDDTVNVGGVDVACTGIGQTKNDPKWLAFPVRVEFARANGDYLANETLTVSQGGGAPMLTVACEGPWVLLKLPAGEYRLEGRSSEPGTQPVVQTARAPAQGQARVVMTFPAAH